jgi:6-phosphogluconolactonase (cycloisomerase 2 family)
MSARTFAYVGCRTTRERNAKGAGIGAYVVCANGEWRHVQTLEPVVNPSFLVVHPRLNTLYTVHGDGDSLSAYRIDPDTGRLAHMNTEACNGRNPVHLDFTRDGRTLVIAAYATGTAARIALNDDGSLGQCATPVLAFDGEPGPHRIEQASSHPHHIARYATRRFDTDWHIVPDKGLDAVFAVRWNADGACVVQQAKSREGAGPRHAAFHPELPLIYVANELDSTLTAWSFDAQSGALAPLCTISVIPAEFHGTTRAAGIAMAADGRRLYVSNRGHDSIATVELDARGGWPGEVQWAACEGHCPRFLCLSPDGRMLYVANETSHSINQFALDETSRVPVATGRRIETGSPVSIAFKTFQE